MVAALPTLAQPALAQSATADGKGRRAPATRLAQAERPPAAAPRPQIPPRRGVVQREILTGNWQSSQFTRTLPIGSRNTFELNNVVGNVVVSGAQGTNAVTIIANRRMQTANKDAANATLQKVVHTITQRGGGIEVLTSLPDGVKERIFVDYEITLPSTAAVSVRAWGGDLRISNVAGEVRAELNGGGDITIANARRIRQAKALLGNVSVQDMDGDELIAETIGGTLQVRNAVVQAMELRSISGQIVVNNAACVRCTVNSISGNIDITSPLQPDARVTVNSNTGNIRLTPTGTPRFNLELLTNGMKQSEFPLNKRVSEARRLLGQVGEDEGSTIISLRSFTGNITVARP
jgi:hypothetical protein